MADQQTAAKFEAALADLVESEHFAAAGGIAATVMSVDGTWSGTVGKADGDRDLQVDDQFAIASITKSLVAAQVMSMVEGGGIPDDYSAVSAMLQREPLRAWTAADVLEQIPAERGAAGSSYEYSGTNYLLLGLVIEHVRGRPLVEVMRSGVLAIDGIERLVDQPDEKPTEPMAMPRGESTAVLENGGGYIPSHAAASAFPVSGGMASDAPSVAQWWRTFCAGEIVSQTTLTLLARSGVDTSWPPSRPPSGFLCKPSSSIFPAKKSLDASPPIRRMTAVNISLAQCRGRLSRSDPVSRM